MSKLEQPKISRQRARQIIRAINSVRLSRSNYQTLKSQVEELFTGYALKAKSLAQDEVIYRGRLSDKKFYHINDLKAPPAALVSGFQRCNSPGNPMFYGGFVLGAIFTEVIGPDKPNGTIYVSRWVAPKDFFALELLPEEEGHANLASSRTQEIIDTFIETKFSSRVHHSYSNDYKVTAAIAEKVLSGNLVTGGTKKFPITPEAGEGLGCIIYPSVQATGRGPNVAIVPSYANRYLTLDCVEEINFERKSEESFEINRIDYAKPDSTDGTLKWAGRHMHWTIEDGSMARIGVEGGQYVVRDESGRIKLTP